jgi:hypothetical protein
MTRIERIVADFDILFPRHHCIVQTIVAKTRVALNSRIAEGCIFIPAECEDSLVHLLGVEYPQVNA